MLAQKWDIWDKWGRQKTMQRYKEAWQRSLTSQWAVIKMKRVEAGEAETGLEIKKFEDPGKVREEALKAMCGDEGLGRPSDSQDANHSGSIATAS